MVLNSIVFLISQNKRFVKLVLYGVRFKAECKVGFLSDRHILIRHTTIWVYYQRQSKVGTLVQPRGRNFLAFAWISFPSLSPNFFH
ncbi:hypothetical protein H5410_021930 [Solanum commersonii]|uniref:Uncharacterized protein n=1 Tax=Solanum commersonii TaxID=4109 RepID=A0A9J5ZCR3_SOLCO|nr:hypothetical protein H5410_021930 [Solanum commersonii]